MDIKYNTTIVNGNNLNLNQTQNEPEILINAPNNNLYSVVMIDIDAVSKSVSTDKSSKTTFLHWWIANIDLNSNFNEVWFTYFPPTPPKGSGVHHYIFYLLRQPNLIIKPTGMDSVLSRAPFNIDYYINGYKMSIVDKKYFTVQS
jgi:phosphatidylethanolamine-binding protein (PEBP) family uncharacterized protein